MTALQNTITQSLTPSEKELSIQTQLENIITSAELGINKVREQPIATPFITGQSAAIQRATATSARPLQTQLAQLQAQRQSAIDISSVQLGFAESALERGERRLEREQATATNRRDDIFEIASNLPPGTSQSDVNRVLNAKTRAEALSIASQFAQPGAEDFELRTIGNQIVRINPQTGQSEVVFEGEVGDDPFTIQQKFTNTLSLRKEFNDESKDFVKIRDSFSRIQAVTRDTSAAGDLALIFNYMKMLDPGSVVRESEFATAANTAGVPERIRAQWNKVLTGERLSDKTRNDFLTQSGNLFNSQLRQQQRLQTDFQKQATDFNLDPELVAPDLSSAINQGSLDLSDLNFSF